jgi:hypothetical protein
MALWLSVLATDPAPTDRLACELWDGRARRMVRYAA